MCKFFVSHHGVPYPWYEVHILPRSYEKTSSSFGDYVARWDVDNFSRISSILANICHVILKKKNFLSGLIVSVNRRKKDTKVTFVSLGLHAERFTVECTEYGNTLFSYFDISTKRIRSILLWIQGLQSICGVT